MKLTIDLTPEQRRTLFEQAALHGMTIEQYVLGQLFPTEQDAAWEELKALLGHRIQEALAGKVSTKSVSDIVNEELGKAG